MVKQKMSFTFLKGVSDTHGTTNRYKPVNSGESECDSYPDFTEKSSSDPTMAPMKSHRLKQQLVKYRVQSNPNNLNKMQNPLHL